MTTTEHITVLFTDPVGSTELQSLLSPEAPDEVRTMHFSTLRLAIASSGGTEVKKLGDSVIVVFPLGLFRTCVRGWHAAARAPKQR